VRGTWWAIATIVIAAGSSAAQDRDFSKVEIKVTPVAGNIYMLEGAGGNIAASIGEDGIVIVDDQYAPLVDKIQAALKGLTDQRVRFIINTHYHEDHVGGNVLLGKSATIIAHDNVRKRLEEGGVAGNGGSMHFEAKPQPEEALPIITFQHDVTLHLNGEDIHALHYPSGHTDGDSVIFFEKSNVVHMGDDFVTYGFPFIDVDGGGSIQGMIDAVQAVIERLPADVKVIPGHGALCGLEDMRKYLKMLEDTKTVVAQALRENKSLEQMKEEKILAPWKDYAGQFVSEDVFIETLFNSLTNAKGSGLIRHN